MPVKSKQINKHKRQISGIIIALIISTGIMAYSSISAGQWFHSPGPMNIGHEKLQCNDCHIASPGSTRQQLQAKLQYALGNRQSDAVFGYKPVDNNNCLKCHERPNDRHPVFRFFEPKFKKARSKIRAQNCVSCHNEHTGIRVSTNIEFCQVCHEKLSLKKDPLTPTHEFLVTGKQWDTCLRCHDFHGNHKMKVPTDIKNAISTNKIFGYFAGDISPYSKEKFHKAKYSQENDSEPRL